MDHFNYFLIIPDLIAAILLVFNGKALIDYVIYMIKYECSFHVILRILATIPAFLAGIYLLIKPWSLNVLWIVLALLSIWLIINIINNKMMMKKYNEEKKNAKVKKIRLG